jgi:asparagine synthase (glutamine-hydrolysing)
MCATLAHRGPDDEGVHLADFPSEAGRGRVALGNRRLSIIDLPGGHQPMSNEDGSIWITFNGEIYNFQEIRRRLRSRHRFKTNSDTEVIIHLYEERGPECLQELRGMFAFAIWDGRQKRLFCARDRLGKKPFVYWAEPGRFVFASEIKAILECPGIPRKMLPTALDLYLTYQYVPHPFTIFKGIQKLPPAHYLVVERGQVRTRRYWSPKFEEDVSLTEGEAIAQIRELLSESVRLRLISDVPLGVFLSGGIDSTIVTGLMSREGARPVKTFSIGFEEEKYDELRYARAVADAFKTEHHEVVVRPKAADIIPKLATIYDEPFADSSAVPTFYVAQMTRQHVKVALSGEGGDECFLGYPRYQAMRLSNKFDFLPKFLKAMVRGALAPRLPASVEPKTLGRRAKRFMGGIGLDPAQRYFQWVSIFQQAEKHSLYTPEFAAILGSVPPEEFVEMEMLDRPHLGPSARAAAADMMTYLPCDLLHKVDMASMTNSLEVRCPFLDHRLVEFAAHIPERLKMRGLRTKHILKKAFADLLPPQVLRRGKMGFGVPISEWFCGELSSYLRDVLLNPTALARGYFRSESVRTMVEDHIARRADHGYRLWALLMFELWHTKYL